MRLIHSVASESALAQLERHGSDATEILVEVNVAGEESKGGVDPDGLGDFIERCPVPVAGLMTMPPFSEDPEDSRPHFARLAELAADHGLAPALDGNEPGLAGRGRGGGDDPPPRHGALRLRRPHRGQTPRGTVESSPANRVWRAIMRRGEPGQAAKGASDGIPRYMAPCARLLRPSRGSRVRRRRLLRARDLGTGTTSSSRRSASRAAALQRAPARDRRRRQRDEIDDIFADDEPATSTRVLRPVGRGQRRRCRRPGPPRHARRASTTPRRSPTASSAGCR